MPYEIQFKGLKDTTIHRCDRTKCSNAPKQQCKSLRVVYSFLLLSRRLQVNIAFQNLYTAKIFVVFS